jgi:KRAB domain-containing zinc finger protein
MHKERPNINKEKRNKDWGGNSKSPTQCEICSRIISRASDMRKHMMIHTGEKPHACEICDKRFIALKDLKRHILTHTGKKPHVCLICGKGYTKADRLQKHTEEIHQ